VADQAPLGLTVLEGTFALGTDQDGEELRGERHDALGWRSSGERVLPESAEGVEVVMQVLMQLLMQLLMKVLISMVPS
jgi:hypothetical protein